MIYRRYIDTPIGRLEIHASDQGLTKLIFPDDLQEPDDLQGADHPHLDLCKHQINEYFLGHRTQFDVPLAPQGTEFQKTVWQALQQIPFGQSVSYLDIAKMIDNPKAVRAVGAANGKNPISIIIPCHRVIGADKSLTGYAGGIPRKSWLLTHEEIPFKEQAMAHKEKSQDDLFQAYLP